MSNVEFEKIQAEAQDIFDAKMRTGLYDHYPESAREILWHDCLRAAAISAKSW